MIHVKKLPIHGKKGKINRQQIGCFVSNKNYIRENNHGYAYIINEVWAECARKKIPLPQHKPVSASSICKARMKLPDNAIKTINKISFMYGKIKTIPKQGKGTDFLL
ncbi:hypothetical protein, partial [Candidatus Erwinia dacicola]|uniref:hypothetical protein n=1 Tax=Candidatus Erwinia dacicola TaxID=252393 RepID=UPI0011D04919